MKTLREFEEYLKTGIVKKQSPDKIRSKDLTEQSDQTFKSVSQIVNEIGINDTNADTIIKESYDSIMSLVRAKMILEGFNSSGIGAHEAQVAYFKKLNFSEDKVQFLNQLRYFRNGIMYYGNKFDKEYTEKVFNFLKEIKNVFKEKKS
jgi:hypothetical protein